MSTESTTATTKSTKASNGGDVAESRSAVGESQGRRAVAVAADEVRGAIEGVGRQLPRLTASSRSAVHDLYRIVERGSDERVTVGVSMSLGMAIGMLIGGAPRLLVALVLVPVAMAGLAMADRRTSSARSSAASSAGA